MIISLSDGSGFSGADGSVYSDVVWFRDISYIAVKIDALQNEKQEAERRERDDKRAVTLR